MELVFPSAGHEGEIEENKKDGYFYRQYSLVGVKKCGFLGEFVKVRFYRKQRNWYCCFWLDDAPFHLCGGASAKFAIDALKGAMNDAKIEVVCEDEDKDRFIFIALDAIARKLWLTKHLIVQSIK